MSVDPEPLGITQVRHWACISHLEQHFAVILEHSAFCMFPLYLRKQKEMQQRDQISQGASAPVFRQQTVIPSK